jgi:AcrR family transcriptional regulator
MAVAKKEIGKRGADGHDRPLRPSGQVEKVRKHTRVTKAERQKQIADVTLRLVARYGVHGATISRIAAGVGLSRAALYKFFPKREAMLEAAVDLLVDRVPRWVERSPGDTVFEHLMGMGNQFGPLGVSVFESFTHPWFQFAAASDTGNLTEELGKRNLVFVQEYAALIEEGKRDGSIRQDVDSELIAWSLMMWAWAGDVARLIGLEDVIGSTRSVEIFRRMLGDIAAREVMAEESSRG